MSSHMSSTLQERHSIEWTLEQLQVTLERSQDRYNTYADLQHQLKLLSSQGGDGKVRMQVDVGAGVMMQAEAASASPVLVDVGLGFRVECGITDARDITSLQMSTAQATMARHAEQGPALQAALLRECRGSWSIDPEVQP